MTTWEPDYCLYCDCISLTCLCTCTHYYYCTVFFIFLLHIRDIEANINTAKQAIAKYKEDLQQARVIRRHRQEYDALAMVR